jgi:hypothetical protein
MKNGTKGTKRTKWPACARDEKDERNGGLFRDPVFVPSPVSLRARPLTQIAHSIIRRRRSDIGTSGDFCGREIG